MKAMLNAHEYLNQTLDQKLTPELIINFHDKALEGVLDDTERDLLEQENQNKFRDGDPVFFGLVLGFDKERNLKPSGNVSYEGLIDFLNEIEANRNVHQFKFQVSPEASKEYSVDLLADSARSKDNKDISSTAAFIKDKIENTGHAKFYIPHMSHDQIKKEVELSIKQYHRAIKKSKTDDQKLDAMINFVQKLERLHPFSDGNCRTLVMLTLNRELIRNGFPPAMFDNPNRFDFFSKAQLKDEIKKGWEIAKQYQVRAALLPSFQKLYEYAVKLTNKRTFTELFKSQKSQKLSAQLDSVFNELKKKNSIEEINEFLGSSELVQSIIQADKQSEKLIGNLKSECQAELKKLPKASI